LAQARPIVLGRSGALVLPGPSLFHYGCTNRTNS
jgi:hypothetical protein